MVEAVASSATISPESSNNSAPVKPTSPRPTGSTPFNLPDFCFAFCILVRFSESGSLSTIPNLAKSSWVSLSISFKSNISFSFAVISVKVPSIVWPSGTVGALKSEAERFSVTPKDCPISLLTVCTKLFLSVLFV